jgi:hypothetical protein
VSAEPSPADTVRARWEIDDVQAAVDAIRAALPGLRRAAPARPAAVRPTPARPAAIPPVAVQNRPRLFVPTRITGLPPNS